MPPHGRRRASTLAILLSLFFIFASTASAASAVLGIDLGTEYIKAALVKPGIPLDIVLTKDSKRKETAAVAFKGLRTKVNTLESEVFPERIYGGDAVALSARFPGDVYPNLKPLLGLSQKSEVVSEYRERHPELSLQEWATTGTLGFKSDSFVKEEELFLVEELLAMELKNIKGNAETMAGKGYSIQDVVITVPSFYTVEERRAVSLAADLAGLRVLSLISDGLAVGLNYATSRTFPTANEGVKPEIHLVYDMGAGSTTATVLKFQGRTVKDTGKYNKTIQEVQVLGTSWDKTLGGDGLNGIILDDMIRKFTDTSRMKSLGLEPKHVKGHGRTMAKLWKEAERIRQVLSANTETSSSFEGLYYEDMNFKYKLSRSEFDTLASTYSARVQSPVEDALEIAKLSFADVDSVILHGGAVRTPFVQKQLESVIKDTEKVRTNVNSDEAAVFGAAFKAAAISPSFRVKEIRAVDGAVYPVFVSWSLEGKDKQQKLFVPTSLVGAEKQLSFKALDDFSFDLFQQVSLPLTDLPVSTIKTQNLTDSVRSLTGKFGCELTDISTKFAIRLSPIDGLPEVVSGSVSCEVTDNKKAGGVVDGVKDFLGFGSKKDAQEPLKEDADSDTSSSTVQSESDSASTKSTSSVESTTSSTESAAEESAKADERPKEVKKRTETISIGFTTEAAGPSKLTSEDLKRMKIRLIAFDASDRSRVLREESLNTLEGYTYKIRDILEDEGFIAASTGAQRDDIEQKSNDASMWLYGDGAEANREMLKARLDELRGLVKPIQKRKDESIKRPDGIKKLQDALQQAKSMVGVVKQQLESHIVAESEYSASLNEETSTTTTAPTTSATDDFADLDDEPATKTASGNPLFSKLPKPIYSEDDLKSIEEKEQTLQKWLDEKLAEQNKLSQIDDPVLLSSDLAEKAQEVNDAVMNLLTRQMKTPPKPKKAKSKPKPRASTKTTSPKATNKDSATESGPSGDATKLPDPDDDDVEIPEGMRRITPEDLDEMFGEKKSKVEKTGKATKSAKPKATAKAKAKGKSKAKAKSKGNGKVEEHGEL